MDYIQTGKKWVNIVYRMNTVKLCTVGLFCNEADVLRQLGYSIIQ